MPIHLQRPPSAQKMGQGVAELVNDNPVFVVSIVVGVVVVVVAVAAAAVGRRSRNGNSGG